MMSSKEFERITEGLSDALGFTQTIGMGMENTPYEKGGNRGVLGEVDFYTRFVNALLECAFHSTVAPSKQPRGPDAWI